MEQVSYDVHVYLDNKYDEDNEDGKGTGEDGKSGGHYDVYDNKDP